MTVNLDWEVEDDDGWQTIEEDPALIAARARREQVIQRVLIFSALAVMLVSMVAAARLDQARRQRVAELEAVVAAETLALRLGDRGAFMAIQSTEERWWQAQTALFDSYQSASDQISATGEILELDINADQARVVVREMLDNQPYRLIWFYTYDRGWRHVPPDPAAWGRTLTSGGPYVRITYQEADELVAQSLAVEFTAWWETACRLTDCRTFRHWQVRLDPDPFAPLVRGEGEVTVIRSPSMGRVTDEGGVESGVRQQLAAAFAALWARSMVASVSSEDGGEFNRLYSDTAWLQQELTVWLAYEISDSGETSGIFGPLYADYGPEIVAEFVREMRAMRSVEAALAFTTGTSPAELDIDWRGFLTHRLQARTALASIRPESAVGPQERRDGLAEVALPGWATPETIQVLSLHESGGITWAEVQFRTRPAWKSPPALMRTYLPFIFSPLEPESAGRWSQPVLGIEDWGEMHEEHGPRVTLRYYDLDARFAVGLLDSLEASYDLAISDLALARDYPPAFVAISPFSAGSLYAPGELPPDSISFNLRSPYTVALLTDMTVEEYLRDVAQRRLALDLRHYFAGQ